jgi:excisionase family DNA binding protein
MLVAAFNAGGAVSALATPRTPDGLDEFLTTDEVAKRLRVHPTTILRRLGAVDDADPERIPAVRVGRVWRIPRREFEEWLARSSQAGRKTGRQRRLF